MTASRTRDLLSDARARDRNRSAMTACVFVALVAMAKLRSESFSSNWPHAHTDDVATTPIRVA